MPFVVTGEMAAVSGNLYTTGYAWYEKALRKPYAAPL
jgi:hypothetical protein